MLWDSYTFISNLAALMSLMVALLFWGGEQRYNAVDAQEKTDAM